MIPANFPFQDKSLNELKKRVYCFVTGIIQISLKKASKTLLFFLFDDFFNSRREFQAVVADKFIFGSDVCPHQFGTRHLFYIFTGVLNHRRLILSGIPL